MTSNVFTLRDPAGLHARLAAQIAETAKRHESDISITFKGVEAKATDMMRLMQIDANENDRLLVTAHGPDEAAAIDVLKSIIEGEG